MLDESHIGLDEPGLDLVVAQARTGIERLDEFERNGHRLRPTGHGLGDFLVLAELHAAQMLIDDHNGVLITSAGVPCDCRSDCRSCVPQGS